MLEILANLAKIIQDSISKDTEYKVSLLKYIFSRKRAVALWRGCYAPRHRSAFSARGGGGSARSQESATNRERTERKLPFEAARKRREIRVMNL